MLVAGCTDANLYQTGGQPNLANKMSLEGDICTDDPSAVSFPVKVLLVMDTTAAMVAGDPTAIRATAMKALFDRYSEKNYTFDVIQYGDTGRPVTMGFTNDPTEEQSATDTISVGTAQARRNYLDALRVATTAVQDDILSSTPGVRSRTRYVVMFVAAGPPAPSLPDFWCPVHVDGNGMPLQPGSQACLKAFNDTFCRTIMPPPADCELAVYPQMVSDLRDFVRANGAQDFVLHTFDLTMDPRAGMILDSMALAGKGVSSHQGIAALNFLAVDLAQAASLLVRRELVVYNPNAVMRNGMPVPDSDADGLSDDEEKALGTNPVLWDSDCDGVGDQIERLLGSPVWNGDGGVPDGGIPDGGPTVLSFDPLACNVPAQCQQIVMGLKSGAPDCTKMCDSTGLALPAMPDTDGDGLNDCEEALLRTDPSLPDTDRDGIPDLVEVRRGGNPLADDVLDDTSMDGIKNGDELKEGLENSVNNAQTELTYGYHYRVFDEGPKMQLEAVPTDPIPGVRVLDVGPGSTGAVGLLHWDPATKTLAWTADDKKMLGPAVDVSKGGNFSLTSGPLSQSMMMSKAGNCVDPGCIDVNVDKNLLPPAAMGPIDFKLLIRTTLRSCFHFDTRNITLVETLAIPGGRPGKGWNVLTTYLGEVPKDTPDGHTIYEISTVPVRFIAPDKKTPDRPFITLTQDSFVLLGGP